MPFTHLKHTKRRRREEGGQAHVDRNKVTQRSPCAYLIATWGTDIGTPHALWYKHFLEKLEAQSKALVNLSDSCNAVYFIFHAYYG
jgi:hypothetical protein